MQEFLACAVDGSSDWAPASSCKWLRFKILYQIREAESVLDAAAQISWTEEPGGLQFTGLQRVAHD